MKGTVILGGVGAVLAIIAIVVGLIPSESWTSVEEVTGEISSLVIVGTGDFSRERYIVVVRADGKKLHFRATLEEGGELEEGQSIKVKKTTVRRWAGDRAVVAAVYYDWNDWRSY